MAPAWEQLGHATRDEENVKVSAVDCSEEAELCSYYGVNQFPTVLLFKNGGAEVKEYQGGRQVGHFKRFLQSEGMLEH
eukprot:CAMPEP_0114539458 /NCGR_PEP_ID=MMETSP0114-20121206/247_1 /TAXON_ID=31324 /ORGANISM="Goniomonas sp, Strain m" /LENGTH=77 /DNA_ID=CAMNT_0001723559 /DNA_START=175 /DNA_END=408 /DNA_ORIENTATION=+